MFNIIACSTKSFGIGKNGNLPWHISEELKLFKKITLNNILLIGRKTMDNIKPLKNRNVFVLTRNTLLFEEALEKAIVLAKNENKKIFVAGGGQIYKKAFEYGIKNKRIDTIYLSILKEEYECDTFIDVPFFKVQNKYEYDEFYHYELIPKLTQENEYLSLLKDVMDNGIEKKGRNGITKSLFGKTIKFNLQDNFPLLTTKKMFFRGVVEELLFFIRGDTDSKKLEDKRIRIWNGNTNREFLDKLGKTDRKEGVMGPMYGYQWRNFNAPYDEKNAKCFQKGLDQLKEVIHQIKNEPHSRRILLTDFNPLQAKDGVLYPCHSIIIQFYVIDGYLDMFCYNRSSDLFHGLPFNIASSSLFLSLIAMITNLKPRNFILSIGDAHIYESHYDSVYEQLSRFPYKLPKLSIKNVSSLEDIENMSYSDFKIEDYEYHSSIKAKMVA